MSKRRCDKCGKFMGKGEPRFVSRKGTADEMIRCPRCTPPHVLDSEDGIDESMWDRLMKDATR